MTTAQERAPDPSVDRIEELAGRILKADILLPKFQRDFVWRRPQILALLDSIFNNFPVGSVLLWRSRQKLRSERDIADLAIADTQFDYPVNYLLDGQQRLSTICGALHWHGTNPKSLWNIVFDLEEKEFIHLETMDDPPVHQIRLNLIPDAAAFFKHVASLDTLVNKDVSKLKQAASELFNRFKDYKIATVTLHDMSIEAVAPIFERINSRGTPLTIVDLMRAATWSEQFDLIDAIQDITDDLEEKNFDSVEKKTILRSISAAAGGGFSESSIDGLRKHDAIKLKSAVGTTRNAYRKTVDFLSTQIGIPSDRQLPYANQMVVLGEVYRSIPSPTAAQLEAMKRWFWRTSIAGYFGGWNTGNMATDQKAVHDFANGAESFEPPLADPGLQNWLTREFRSNTAHSRVLVLLLSNNKPVDLLTGAAIDVQSALYQGNNRQFHHFFPKAYLAHAKNISERSSNVLANIVMLSASSNKIITNRSPSDYLKQALDSLGAAFTPTLESNLISNAAYHAALADDYETFLEERAKTLRARVNRLTQWANRNDVPLAE